jgi:outer membrane protein assembly factor BamB
MKHSRPAFLPALALSLAAAFSNPATTMAAPAADHHWPAWRGPLANGVAPLGDPPQTWSETQNVQWKVPVPGRGHATPIVWGDLVFVQTAIPAAAPVASATPPPAPAETQPAEGRGGRRGGRGGFGGGPKPDTMHRFVMMALDRNTGAKRWEKVVRDELPHEGHHSDGTFASSSPVADDQLVIAFFGSRGLHALDHQGNVRWAKDLGRMQTKMTFGEGSSPALHQDTLVVNWDHEGEDFVAAFDKNTGQELWRQARDEETSWSSPLILTHEGQTQVIISATRKVRSYDLKTGKLLWECGGMTANTIPTPVAADGLVYPISGFRGSSLLAIRLGRTGDLTGTDAIAWQHNRSTPYVPSPLLYDGRLYFFGGNNPILSSFDARTGQPVIDAERLEGLQGVYASPVAAGGRIYLLGRNGAAAVLRKSDRLELVATNQLEDRFDASPAIAGKQLFLRGHQSLYCLAQM